MTYTQLRTGSHTFAVRAIDPAGNRSGTTRFSWTILTAVHAFSITAAPAGGLYPGAVVPVDLDITNPYNFAIVVSGLTVEPEDATTRDGLPNPACSGTTNLVTSRQYSGPALVIPKKATRSLSDLAVPESQWPQLEMPNLPTNQDACKATTFTFGSSGTATRGTP